MATVNEDPQSVLSEVSHDLANRFHRSYYFLELLGDAVSGAGDDARALVAKVRDTVEEIESMARGALNYMRPVELRLLEVRLDDLVASLRQHVGLAPMDVGGEAAAGESKVLVDPARISEILSWMGRTALGGAPEGTLRVDRLTEDGGVGLRVHRLPGAAPLSASDLALAVNARLVRLHGGRLALDEAGPGTVTMVLPVGGGRP